MSIDSHVLLQLWGKTGKDNLFHPALFHMLDVAHVAQVLLSHPLCPRYRQILSAALGTGAQTLTQIVPFLIGLHDIGKLSVSFQSQVPEQAERLRSLGLSFASWKAGLAAYTWHPLVGQAFAAAGEDGLDLPRDLRRVWHEAIGSHHGRFVAADAWQETARCLEGYEVSEWKTMRRQAALLLESTLLPQEAPMWPAVVDMSAGLMALTGFTILCDWLGSDSDVFPPCPHVSLEAYLPLSRERAADAVGKAGLAQPSLSAARMTFGYLFPDIQRPRPLQAAVDDIPLKVLSTPCLAIIEAPTGEGKTEAALALAHRLAEASGTDELYYALPTTATSNQMFGRLQEHLQQRLHLPTGVKLIHGQAFLVEDDLRLMPPAEGEEDMEANLEWFGPRKRALLAPFGVGTIDQAELAALNVKHTALRQVGLAGKVVILDEVHAYDTYMTTVVARLLRWLAAMGTSVILLSATLPLSRRLDLAQAYNTSLPATMAADGAYPSLWVVGAGGTHHASPPAYQPERRLALGYLGFMDSDCQGKARWLLDQVKSGGCACWMCNTVERAQKLFQEVRALAGSDTDVLLLHARFPLEQRQDLEKLLTARYGPRGARPRRGIVIGTQVLEQSLDLDFDVMASDLAPVDLLLQRAGRLHRHAHRVASRPESLRVPHLWINREEEGSDLHLSRADCAVYDEYLLRQTWETLRNRTAIALPADYRPLVEAVYGAGAPPSGTPLHTAWQKLQDKQSDAEKEARLRLLPEPRARRSFCAQAAGLSFREEENSAAWIVAQTRLGEESVSVIPLVREGAQARLAGTADALPMDMATAPLRDMQLRMLRRSLRISRQTVVAALKAEASALPALFSQAPLLRGQLPLWLDSEGRSRLSAHGRTVTLLLDPVLGLVIGKGGD